MERQKSKHEKRERKKTGIKKKPKTTTTTKKWIRLYKKWKFKKKFILKLRGKTNLIFFSVGLK